MSLDWQSQTKSLNFSFEGYVQDHSGVNVGRKQSLMFAQFFFIMNLVFNGIMWGLFTRALTLASSTVRVSIMNTSANFMITAILGWFIFSESLPGLWFLGAAMLVAGSVIIGRREEGKESGAAGTAGAEPTVLVGEDDPDAPLAGSRSEQPYSDEVELTNNKNGNGDDDIDVMYTPR